MMTVVSVSIVAITNKRDGYRQQNVRQRQKLISIIDYDVCILKNLHVLHFHVRHFQSTQLQY